jgi:hypothetical protein
MTRTWRVLTGSEREETARRAADLYVAGCTIHSTARQIGRSYGNTRQLLLEAGVTLRPRGGMQTRFGTAAR